MLLFKLSVAEKSLPCDFESSYACGYQPLVEGRIQWERINVKDGDQHTSPSLDASRNSRGKIEGWKHIRQFLFSAVML